MRRCQVRMTRGNGPAQEFEEAINDVGVRVKLDLAAGHMIEGGGTSPVKFVMLDLTYCTGFACVLQERGP